MSETTLTVNQIRDLGLWEKVCDYKGWDYYIINEGRISTDELVTFDSEFKEVEEYSNRKLATLLHEKSCCCNHVDDCTWYYENDDWSKYTHSKYLNKANELLELEVYVKDIEKIINIISK